MKLWSSQRGQCESLHAGLQHEVPVQPLTMTQVTTGIQFCHTVANTVVAAGDGVNNEKYNQNLRMLEEEQNGHYLYKILLIAIVVAVMTILKYLPYVIQTMDQFQRMNTSTCLIQLKVSFIPILYL